ncbi:hypothetical protein CPAV1605_1106 [seawater metagenome]|uniref:Uncharacterized protein n=1 Tax=seawater metagenome TaxID=1561972 RepID=A0A5E8CLV4_9ZZZZ
MLDNKFFWILIGLLFILYTSKKENFGVVPNESNIKYPLALKQRSQDYIDKTKNLDQKLPRVNCCKVSRKMKKDGKWYYDYQEEEGKQCMPYGGNIVIPNKIEYYYEKTPLWESNKMCSADYKTAEGEQYLGSCRNAFNTCMDFIPQDECKKLPAYIWSKKTCRDKITLPQEFVPYQDFIVFDDI